MAKLLIVEDNKDFRQTLERMATMLGHSVVATCSSAGDAIRFLQKDNVDIMVADVGLPDHLSPVLYWIKSSKPSLKVLLMSGTPYDTLVLHRKIPESKHFLSKPFSIKNLDEALQKLEEQ